MGGLVSPFFIMHLPKLPTIFVKGGEERKAFFTIQAKELLAAGWVEKTEEAPAAAPEPPAEEEVKAAELKEKQTAKIKSTRTRTAKKAEVVQEVEE
jgi:hypothetical protein